MVVETVGASTSVSLRVPNSDWSGVALAGFSREALTLSHVMSYKKCFLRVSTLHPPASQKLSSVFNRCECLLSEYLGNC